MAEAKVVPGRGPICLDAETWRSRATNDSPSKWDHRLVEGPPPATPTDCINQHPFSLRRVWRMDLLDFRNQFFPNIGGSPRKSLKRKTKIIIVGGKPPLNNIQHLPINQHLKRKEKTA